jgi:hypothetical protein
MNLKKVITFSGVMMILFSFVFFVLAYEGESYLYLVGVGLSYCLIRLKIVMITQVQKAERPLILLRI